MRELLSLALFSLSPPLFLFFFTDGRREERKREEGRRSGGGDLALRSRRETDASNKLLMYGKVEGKRERKERRDGENERERERERETGMCGRERGENTRGGNTMAIACNRVDREIFITPLLSYAYK